MRRPLTRLAITRRAGGRRSGPAPRTTAPTPRRIASSSLPPSRCIARPRDADGRLSLRRKLRLRPGLQRQQRRAGGRRPHAQRAPSTDAAMRPERVQRQGDREPPGARRRRPDRAARGSAARTPLIRADYTRKVNPYAVEATLAVYPNGTQRLYAIVRGGNSLAWFDVLQRRHARLRPRRRSRLLRGHALRRATTPRRAPAASCSRRSRRSSRSTPTAAGS